MFCTATGEKMSCPSPSSSSSPSSSPVPLVKPMMKPTIPAITSESEVVEQARQLERLLAREASLARKLLAYDRGPLLSTQYSKYKLYEIAVQSTYIDLEMIDLRFTELFDGRKPLSLREDFCGSCLLSRDWIKSSPDRTALCVDLGAEVLKWGRRYNIETLPKEAQNRIQLFQEDVRYIPQSSEQKVDVVHAGNASFCVFKRRRELVEYFLAAYQNIKEDTGGMFMLELMGGPDMEIVGPDEAREFSDFHYVWDQQKFNVVTRELLAHIHFRFPRDGSIQWKAFTYDWRMWTLPEIKEALEEAGFGSPRFYLSNIEDMGEDGFSAKDYKDATEYFPSCDAWTGYIVAMKKGKEITPASSSSVASLSVEPLNLGQKVETPRKSALDSVMEAYQESDE